MNIEHILNDTFRAVLPNVERRPKPDKHKPATINISRETVDQILDDVFENWGGRSPSTAPMIHSDQDNHRTSHEHEKGSQQPWHK